MNIEAVLLIALTWPIVGFLIAAHLTHPRTYGDLAVTIFAGIVLGWALAISYPLGLLFTAKFWKREFRK